MVHHIVLYKLKPEVTPARVEEMMMNARMQLLKIPEVLSIKCGKRIDSHMPWPFFIALDFETMDKLANYLNIKKEELWQDPFDIIEQRKVHTRLDLEDWLTDPRFEKYADRRMNWDKFVDEFEAWSRTLSVTDCVAALEKHGVPCSPYYTVTEALKDPQVEHRGSLCTIEDSAGAYKSPAPPFRFSGSALQSGPRVAGLGEDTKSVLSEAGLSDAEIKALVK